MGFWVCIYTRRGSKREVVILKKLNLVKPIVPIFKYMLSCPELIWAFFLQDFLVASLAAFFHLPQIISEHSFPLPLQTTTTTALELNTFWSYQFACIYINAAWKKKCYFIENSISLHAHSYSIHTINRMIESKVHLLSTYLLKQILLFFL